MSRVKRKLFATEADPVAGNGHDGPKVSANVSSKLSTEHSKNVEKEDKTALLGPAVQDLLSEEFAAEAGSSISVRTTAVSFGNGSSGISAVALELHTAEIPLSARRRSSRRKVTGPVDASEPLTEASLKPKPRARKKVIKVSADGTVGNSGGADLSTEAILTAVEASQSLSAAAVQLDSPAAATPAAPAGGQPTRRRTKSRIVATSAEVLVAAAIEGPTSIAGKEELKAAIDHLRAADARLAALIEAHEEPELWGRSPCTFRALMRSIVSQQLSTKVASVIHGRLVALCGEDEAAVKPEALLRFPVPELRAIGLSNAKARYVHDLAAHFLEGKLSDSSILAMEDEALMAALTAVKGIGAWSVHMFMMFSLRRPDVLPVGDLGVRKGFQKLYALSALPGAAEMEALAATWRPYRTVGCCYLWRMMDTKAPVAGTALF